MTDDHLDVSVAELRPALEAILMVADQPLDEVAGGGQRQAQVLGDGRDRLSPRRLEKKQRAHLRHRELELLEHRHHVRYRASHKRLLKGTKRSR